MIIQSIRGMKDFLPNEVKRWQFIENTIRDIFITFGFQEVRIPILEKTELYHHYIGDTSDIVEKEMYTFFDKSGVSLTMRPEGTMGILRAYVEHKLYVEKGPHKFFFIGPMFRYERPQKGRYRQFHQVDVEVIDDDGPQMDAELIIMLSQLFQKLDLKEIIFKINTLGCKLCFPIFYNLLRVYFIDKNSYLCTDCQRKVRSNSLRVLDCKNNTCKDIINTAPSIYNYLCKECNDHFTVICDLLRLSGVIYEIDYYLVRGLDYYTRTVFEVIISNYSGSQNAVVGGGRYDGLIESLGGPVCGGIGFGLGLERLIMLLSESINFEKNPDIFLIAVGEKSRAWAFVETMRLRKMGIWIEKASQDKSLKSQMRKANKLKVPKVIIVTDEGLANQQVLIKNMSDGSQYEIFLTDFFKNSYF